MAEFAIHPTPHAVDYDALDPGIRDLVRLLNDNGIGTCDSGDGVSKPIELREFEVPHVFAIAKATGVEGLIEIYEAALRMVPLLPQTVPRWSVQVMLDVEHGRPMVGAIAPDDKQRRLYEARNNGAPCPGHHEHVVDAPT